jgi:hypothetical protein
MGRDRAEPGLGGGERALLLVTGHLELTALGYAFVLVQAVLVAALTEAQYVGLRRLAATP